MTLPPQCPVCDAPHTDIESVSLLKAETWARAEETLRCDQCNSTWKQSYTLEKAGQHEVEQDE